MSHLIEKIVVDIQTRDRSSVKKDQDLISQSLNSTSFHSLLSMSLDKLSGQNGLYRFEKIELEIHFENADSFAVNLIKALQQFLRQNKKKEHLITEGKERNDPEIFDEPKSPTTQIENLVLFYLKNGFHDWHVRKQQKHQIQVFLKNYAENPGVVFDVLLLDHVLADKGLVEHIYQYLGESKFLQLMERHPAHPGIRVFQNYRSPEGEESPDNRIASEANQLSISAKSRKVKPEGVLQNLFYIEHAGVVLLSPFFTQLFRQLGFTTDHQFIDIRSREKSFLVLQYLVNGDEEEQVDFGCPLFKILTGLPYNHLIRGDLNLLQSEKSVINQLLQFALEQWPVLKNTSPAGLQQSFLQRPGKLSGRQDGNWDLLVERKTIDILLERLPPGWTYSMLRLPWMKKFIYVIW